MARLEYDSLLDIVGSFGPVLIGADARDSWMSSLLDGSCHPVSSRSLLTNGNALSVDSCEPCDSS